MNFSKSGETGIDRAEEYLGREISIGDAFGVNPVHTAITMVVCRNCAAFISPVVPATFLGVGLAGVEIKDHIKNSFF